MKIISIPLKFAFLYFFLGVSFCVGVFGEMIKSKTVEWQLSVAAPRFKGSLPYESMSKVGIVKMPASGLCYVWIEGNGSHMNIRMVKVEDFLEKN